VSDSEFNRFVKTPEIPLKKQGLPWLVLKFQNTPDALPNVKMLILNCAWTPELEIVRVETGSDRYPNREYRYPGSDRVEKSSNPTGYRILLDRTDLRYTGLWSVRDKTIVGSDLGQTNYGTGLFDHPVILRCDRN